MFIARLGMENVACLKVQHLFAAGSADTHIDTSVEDGEHLRAVVDVPAVGLVGPVQPHGRIVEPLDR